MYASEKLAFEAGSFCYKLLRLSPCSGSVSGVTHAGCDCHWESVLSVVLGGEIWGNGIF